MWRAQRRNDNGQFGPKNEVKSVSTSKKNYKDMSYAKKKLLTIKGWS